MTVHRLTSRELTVLYQLSAGLTAASIARRLDVSTRTVHKHLENLYRKLDCKDRLAAVLVAQQLGLLQTPALVMTLGTRTCESCGRSTTTA